MSRGPSTSPYDRPVPDLPTLSDPELLAVWHLNRNGLQGALAADEMMKRLLLRETKKETSHG